MRSWKGARVYRRSLWVMGAVLLVVNLIISARIYSEESPAEDEKRSAYQYISLFTHVLEQIRANYVEPEQTSYKDLIYKALHGMLRGLDPHSEFMEPEEYKDMRDDTSGQFGGLGIVISIRDGILTIVAPMEDTPGYRAGLMAGDRIIEIEGESTEGISLPDAVHKLRGEPGTQVTIRIFRPRTQEIKEVTITRAKIKVPSIKDVRMVEDGIGYLRITQFNQPVGAALDRALDELREQGLKALIIDLRNNPGGLLSSAVQVSQRFLPRGALIVTTEGRNNRVLQTFRSRGLRHLVDLPLAVLINGGSASASEIVAGALKDHRRAVLVGEKSFGKGSVQTVIPLSEGSAIRLTTAHYYTPSHRRIQDRGIEPDIVVPVSAEEWQRLQLQRTRPKDERLPESEPEVPDRQLERAVSVLKGVLLFEQAALHKPGAALAAASR